MDCLTTPKSIYTPRADWEQDTEESNQDDQRAKNLKQEQDTRENILSK